MPTRLSEVLRDVVGRVVGRVGELAVTGPVGRLLAPASRLLAPVRRLLAPVSRLLTVLGVGGYRNRFVLIIGDEGATLVQMQSGRVVDAVFVGQETEDGPETLRPYFEGDPGAQVVVVADVLEQMYREDSIPKVGLLDKGSIIQRRLDMLFANDPLRGALPLPRKRGMPQWVLFAALPSTPNLERWTAFVESLTNPVTGFGLMPLEAVGLADVLGPSTAGEQRHIWRALITQQATSGVRQVFQKNGRFVVSRLTQKVSREMTAEAEAMLVERELRSSISYVKRLGFVDADRLDVIVLAEESVGAAVAERELPVSSLTVLTPFQAGIAAGFGEIGREDTPFADILMAKWVASRRDLRITLPSPRLKERLHNLRMSRLAVAGAAAVTLLTLMYCGSFAVDYFDAQADAARIGAEIPRLQSTLAIDRKRVEKYPIPFDKLRPTAEVEEKLAKREVDPITLFQPLVRILDPSTRVDKVSYTLAGMTTTKVKGQTTQRTVPPARAGYELHLVIVFPGATSADPNAAIEQAKIFKTKLEKAYPDCAVETVRLPVAIAPSQVLEGSGESTRPAVAAKLSAEYVIRKAS